jgi:tetratricopeptide (TPR) repeat protein
LSGHGDPGAAVGHYQRALRQNPALLHAHNNLGNALFALARYSEAAAAYRAALEMNPDDAKIHSNLGNTLRNLGSLPEAISSTRRAVAIDPALADAHNNLGLALAAQGEFEQARESYREALARHPHYVDALNNLGNVLRDLGERRESAELYMRAVALDPAHAESHCNLGNVLFESQRTEEAAASYERAIALKDNYPVAHLSYAMALRMLGRTQAAEASCRKSLSLQPDCAEALALLGELRADQGQFAEAQELFECALRADPAFPFAYFNIAMHRKMTAADESWFAAAQSLTARRLPLRHEISLRYALGKYHDDLQDYDAAFDNYFRANELTKRNGLKYDAAQLTRHADEVIELFDAASLRRAQAHGSDAERPVFIVGMPRSGTSLTEQILASHPAVFGAGELSFWDGALSAYKAAAETNADAARELLPRMAEDYEMRLAALSAGAARVIDKMPPNFMNIGLIHAAFPRARIIHMQRHPIDTCLSIYFQYFFNTHPYANDLGSLAHYYREYLRVMEHWRSILAPGALLEVPYESLVSDQELWSRRLLDFVGLPWDAKCLSFHETNRVVLTASKWQVRQKIHTGSRGRWRNYERFVGPLRTLAET